MTSRLDRLFALLESGQSSVTRRAAAQQIGEVQKLHPHELHNLLNRIEQNYLQNSSWETRIAAGQTIEAVLKNVPKWTPVPAISSNKSVNGDEETGEKETGEENKPASGVLLSFDSFNLQEVLTDGARLIASEGLEFDFSADDSSQSNGGRVEALVRQQKLINEKLGLTQGLTIDQIITLDDMKVENEKPVALENKKSVQDIIKAQQIQQQQQQIATASNLSCREQNRARRKARQTVPTNGAVGVGSNGAAAASKLEVVSEEPFKKKIKVEPLNNSENGHSISGYSFCASSTTSSSCSTSSSSTNTPPTPATTKCLDPVPDATGSWDDTATSWPFQSFCTKLVGDLFKPRWEIRHGSATGLRELFKAHLDGAGKKSHTTREEMEIAHLSWVEDVSLRLLSVLALDRFGDFVSDQVIAPVRETCAQVLGILLKEMPEERVTRLINIVLTMVNHRQTADWEVRHGGLLVIKYLLVVREDLLATVLPMVINSILAGLFDVVDDVSAVAASTLIPIVTWLPKLLTASDVSNILKTLWNLLLEQDELTSACNSFMGLLAAILGLPNAAQWIEMEPAEQLVPRLWPFLCHSSSSVRRSTLTTLKTLTMASNESNGGVTGSAEKITTTVSSTSTSGVQFGVKDWPYPLLQEALRHTYQRILIEHLEEVQAVAEEVWLQLIRNADLSALLHAACPYVTTWLCLAMQPARLAFDPSYLIMVRPTVVRKRSDLGGEDVQLAMQQQQQQKFYLGGAETIPLDVREKNVMRARYKACQMIGALSKYLVLPAPGVLYTPEVESPIDCYTKVLNGHLVSRSALQRLITGLVIAFWAQKDQSVQPGPPVIQERLRTILVENIYYEEVTAMFARLLEECRCFMATLKQYHIPIPAVCEGAAVLTLEQVHMFATWPTSNLKQEFHLRVKLVEMVEDRRKSLFNSYTNMMTELDTYNTYTQAALAGAAIAIRSLPEKLNPVVKPIMESLKREENAILQKLSADFLVSLLDQLRERCPCPNAKIVTNLSKMLRGDAEFTPRLVWPERAPIKYLGREKLKEKEKAEIEQKKNLVIGILTLSQQQKADSAGQRSHTGGGPRPVGRPPNTPVEVIPPIPGDDSAIVGGSSTSEVECPQNKLNKLHRVGATFALTKVCEYFGAELPQKIPSFWELMQNKWIVELTEEAVHELLEQNDDGDGAKLGALWNREVTEEILTALQLMEICVPYISRGLDDRVFTLLPNLCHLLRHPLCSVRHLTARCVASFAKVDPVRVMDVVMVRVVPSLKNIDNVVHRQGAIEAIACIVQQLQFQIVPYVVLLIVPVLGRMSDFDQSVRLMATHSFATLIQLMPLDGSSLVVPKLSPELWAKKEKDKKFLEHLFTPKSIPDVQVPKEVKAELRGYQQAGVNWLWFLNRYKLHGILCDDMGLGKTLQAICVLAGDHMKRREEGEPEWPSLVVCPPTLTGNWVYEVQKFVPNNFLSVVHYVGFPADREKLRGKVRKSNLVIASYDIVRKDIEFFRKIHWNYVVLDEGHIIKNGKTKSSKAIKLLVANHRLILSGTPIQNNVLELWSLFDFLMPGFLGTERQFITRYSRPILASRDGKSSPKEQEAGTLALESLHRQVLPFLLRRIKEDVLLDLPPKITQDLLCELSPLQEKLYEDFSKLHLDKDLQSRLGNGGGGKANGNGAAAKEGGAGFGKSTHVFQALRYLQNVCNHPKLVVNQHHPQFEQIMENLQRENSSLNNIEHSAKLPALKQLLLDCGIGNWDVSVNQHRALIFCQLKAMLDIVENDLLKVHLPAVTYLRLDGSIPPATRIEIVEKFNSDPSIDVLLLTTQVGGLGLNLTGADTVIFVEHDWNPMKDLQAMDRAHRIGQKKVVNVYRLITRKSLEEKIMGLQKFKLLTANTVVSDENASMETMGTDQLLDLFNLSDQTMQNRRVGGRGGVGEDALVAGDEKGTMNSILKTLPELWEDKQYEEEYDLTQFMDGLRKN